jgi:hypothetical protein
VIDENAGVSDLTEAVALAAIEEAKTWVNCEDGRYAHFWRLIATLSEPINETAADNMRVWKIFLDSGAQGIFTMRDTEAHGSVSFYTGKS